MLGCREGVVGLAIVEVVGALPKASAANELFFV